jgi:hypothetical protein
MFALDIIDKINNYKFLNSILFMNVYIRQPDLQVPFEEFENVQPNQAYLDFLRDHPPLAPDADRRVISWSIDRRSIERGYSISGYSLYDFKDSASSHPYRGNKYFSSEELKQIHEKQLEQRVKAGQSA